MPKRAVPKGQGERVAVLSRTTREMRQRLEEAAAKSGRSLGQEVEYRLESTFQREDLFYEVIGREHAKFISATVTALRDAIEEMKADPDNCADYNEERQLCAVLVGLAQGISCTPASELLNDEFDNIWQVVTARAVARLRGITPFHAEALVSDPGDKARVDAAANYKLPPLEKIMRR
jgi:hypothetical protein